MEVFWCRIGPWQRDLPAFAAWCRDRDISLTDFWDLEDAIPHVAGLALLRLVWRRVRGTELPPLQKTKAGKPYLPLPHAFFSLSHAGNLVLCALGSRPVGVDVEAIRPVDPDLYSFLRPEEAAHLAALDEPARTAAFFGLWTRKESYVKLLGSGLDGLRSVESTVTAEGVWKDRLSGRPVRPLDLWPGEYAGAVCLALDEPVETTEVPWEALAAEPPVFPPFL